MSKSQNDLLDEIKIKRKILIEEIQQPKYKYMEITEKDKKAKREKK
jgi:hypothetical protein